MKKGQHINTLKKVYLHIIVILDLQQSYNLAYMITVDS